MSIDFEEEESSSPKIDFEEEATPEEDGVLESTGKNIRAGLRGMTQSVFADYGDEIIGGLQHPVGGVKAILGKGSQDPDVQAYQGARNEMRQKYKQSAKESPKSYAAGSILAALKNKLVKKLGTSVLKNSAMGAVLGGGSSEAELADREYGQLAKDSGIGGLTGGVMAKLPARTTLGALGGAYLAKDDLAEGKLGTAAAKIGGGAALATIAPKVPGMVRKGFSSALGVNDDAVKDYLARSKEINSSPSKKEMINRIETVATDAQNAKNAAAENLKNATGTRLESAAATLQDDLEILKKEVISGSKNARSKIPTAAGQVKKQGAGELVPTGKNAPLVGSIQTKELKRVLGAAINRMKPDKDIAAPPGATSDSVGRLQAWRSWLDELPPNLTFEQAKKILRRLDPELDAFFSREKGSFAPEEQIGLSVMRRAIDQKLKAGVPEYAEAMVPVAENARLLGRLNRQNVGKGAASTIKNIGAPQNAEKRKLIEQLGKKTGKNYTQMADPAAERAALEAAEAQAAPLAEVALKSSGKSNAEALLNRGTVGKELEVAIRENDERLISAIEKQYPELRQHIKNLRTQNAFTGERTHGARNAVRFGAAGAALGSAVGSPYLGAAAGASTGAYIDKHGPKLAKTALDMYVPKRDGAQQVIAKLASSPAGSAARKYLEPLKQAADRGEASFATTYYLMSQSYPELRQFLQQKDE